MSDTSPPLDETLLDNRFRLLEPLGHGGQAKTFLALDTFDNRNVVVKQLHWVHLENWKALELFEREAQTLRQLNHPLIPALIASFHLSDEGLDRQRFVIVQELIPGPTLAALIDQGHCFSHEEVLALLRDVLSTLHYLHALSPPVIHRDIKPNNLIRRPDGRWVLIDFGAIQSAIASASTMGSTIVGTSGYMAPEQFMGRALPASDLYALGATLIHLLSHRHPADIPLERMTLAYRPLLPSAPEPLLRLIDDLVAPHIEDRLGSAKEALERLDTLDVSAPLSHPERSTSPSEDIKDAERKDSRKKDNPFQAAALVVLLLVVAGIAYQISSVSSFGTPPPRSPPPVLTPSPFTHQLQDHRARFEALSFNLLSDLPLLPSDALTLEPVTLHDTLISQVRFGVALVNHSSLAIDTLKIDASLLDAQGQVIAAQSLDAHMSFQPPAIPGDRIVFNLDLPLPEAAHTLRLLLVSATTHPAPTEPLPSAKIPLRWLSPPPTGCTLEAETRLDRYERRYPSATTLDHDLHLRVTNSSARCAFQTIELEKRLLDADNHVLSSKKSYLNAPYEPPLAPHDHLTLSLDTSSAPPYDHYEVVVIRADVISP